MAFLERVCTARPQVIFLFCFVLILQHCGFTLSDEQFCPVSNKMEVENVISELFEHFWRWRLVNAPEFATSIGVHKYNDRLDEISLNSYKRREDEARFFLKDLQELKKKISVSKVSDATLLNVNLLEEDLEQVIDGLAFQSYLFPINILEGPQLDFPRLLSWMEMKTVSDFENIISRMRLFPEQIDATIKLLDEGIRKGMTMHSVSVATLPVTLTKLAAHQPENASHFKPFKTKPEAIKNSVWNQIVERAKTVIKVDVLPVYQRLGEYIKNVYLPETRENIAASSLPNGKSFYEGCLKFHTSTNMTPQEVHDKGKEEVERITGRMMDVKEQVGFKGNLKEFREFLRTDPKFKFKSKEDIVQHYNGVCENITKILPKYFMRMPKSKMVIEPVPDEVAAGFPGAYYLAPPEDGSRPATFYINTHKPTSRNKYEAVALSLHEAQPGHHLQTALTMESGGLVTFRRFMEDRKYYEPPGRFAMNTGYIEGWGLYSEYLGEEMGLYEDPYDLFGRFSMEMLRASRLVVDTGMHALGWSRRQAIDYMMEHTASDENDVTSEIDRYITWPGQACGYKIGEIKIRDMRKFAEESLGQKFDVRMFHDFIASMGGVPLNILKDQIKKFVDEQKSK